MSENEFQIMILSRVYKVWYESGKWIKLENGIIMKVISNAFKMIDPGWIDSNIKSTINICHTWMLSKWYEVWYDLCGDIISSN